MAKLLLGKEVTASLNEEIRKKTELLTANHITPKLNNIRIRETEDNISNKHKTNKQSKTHTTQPPKNKSHDTQPKPTENPTKQKNKKRR